MPLGASIPFAATSIWLIPLGALIPLGVLIPLGATPSWLIPLGALIPLGGPGRAIVAWSPLVAGKPA